MNTFKTLTEAFNTQCQHNQTITYIEGKDKETVVSYAELQKRALGLLAYFQQRGLKQGDELIVFLKNNERFIDVFWACILGGIVPVPVAVGISDEHRSKLFKIFNKLSNGYIYIDSDNLQRLEKYSQAQAMQTEYAALAGKAIEHDSITDIDVSIAGQVANVQPDDLAFIQFSSGSTSDPKGVLLTHKNIITNVNAIAAGGGYTEQDCTLSWMPLTHDMGLIGFHINMLVWNMKQCIMATDLFSRRPLLWMQKASEYKATILCSPNFGYKHYLKSLVNKEVELDLSAVRLIYNGAEPISVDICEQFLSRLKTYGLKHNTMFTVYGLAEATLAVAFPELATDYRAIHLDRHDLLMGDKVSIVNANHSDAASFAIEGPAINDIEIKITDKDNNTLATEHIGDIQIKGASVTQGYYLNEEANATALTGDGWLNTGDLGFLHNNELVVTGRTKDIIFANGQNYFPHDLESIALQHEQLELGKVVVYGVSHPEQQKDELVIFILYRADMNEFLALARDVAKLVNSQAGLQVDTVVPVKRIPKTTSGKVQRRLLADAYLAGEFNDVLQAIHEQDASNEAVEENLTALQLQLLAICNEVVEDKTIRSEDNFFDVGISSLALAEIHAKIDDAYPDLIDVVDLFEFQTVIEVSKLIEEKQLVG
ncbi:Polyketide synthase modules and related proteins [hydrothermal vent metagenome]|uniref:Polyketide synthase modules and related proteins n=1 Tax=hydrothermal vent metagenome TaxID=652676 RepID=A0A3B0ZX23_9ZZZZ